MPRPIISEQETLGKSDFQKSIKILFYNKLFAKNLEFKKIGSIKYQDGAKMLTVVWSVIDTTDLKATELKTKFEEFEAKGGIDLMF